MLVAQLAAEMGWPRKKVLACLDEAGAAGLIRAERGGIQATIPGDDQ